jgi:hypothetical protein
MLDMAMQQLLSNRHQKYHADDEQRLLRALPNAPVSPEEHHRRLERKKMIVLLIVCGVGLVAIALMFLITALTGRQQQAELEGNPTKFSPVAAARDAELREREGYVKPMIDWNRSSDSIPSGVGWKQQALANFSSEINNEISKQLQDESSPIYRLDANVGLAMNQELYNEMLALAARGQSATLVYTDANGELTEQKIKPAQFAAFAMDGLLAVDMATYLSYNPKFDLIAAYTDLTEAQNNNRLAWAERVAAQNLKDPAEKIKNIQSWRKQALARKKISETPASESLQAPEPKPRNPIKGGLVDGS